MGGAESAPADLLGQSGEVPREACSKGLFHGPHLTLLTTNDMHSHIEGATGTSHYARLASSIARARKEAEARGDCVLLLDAGDWCIGSRFDVLAADPASAFSPELTFFHRCGYDAIVFGNHDFDMEGGESGLATAIGKCAGLDGKLPILATNLRIADSSPLARFVDAGPVPIVQSCVRECQGIRVGLIGAMGPDAAFSIMEPPEHVSFDGFRKGALVSADLKSLVKKLCAAASDLRHDGCDIVILIAHSGSPEDSALGKLMRGHIDIMVCGHTHERYVRRFEGDRPLYLSQGGANAEYLGIWRYGIGPSGVNLESGQLRPVDHSFDVVPGIADLTTAWEAELESNPKFAQLSEVVYEAADSNSALLHSGMTAIEVGCVLCTCIREELRTKRSLDVYFTVSGMIRETLENSKAIVDSTVRLDRRTVQSLLAMTGACGVVCFRLTARHLHRMVSFFAWLAKKVSTPENASLCISDTLIYNQEWLLHGKPYSEWPAEVVVATNALMFKRFVQSLSGYTLHLYRVTPHSVEKVLESEPDLAAAALAKKHTTMDRSSKRRRLA